jgi:hypothetical protein
MLLLRWRPVVLVGLLAALRCERAALGRAAHHVEPVEHLVAQVRGEAHVQRPAGGVAHYAGRRVLQQEGEGQGGGRGAGQAAAAA